MVRFLLHSIRQPSHLPLWRANIWILETHACVKTCAPLRPPAQPHAPPTAVLSYPLPHKSLLSQQVLLFSVYTHTTYSPLCSSERSADWCFSSCHMRLIYKCWGSQRSVKFPCFQQSVLASRPEGSGGPHASGTEFISHLHTCLHCLAAVSCAPV